MTPERRRDQARARAETLAAYAQQCLRALDGDADEGPLDDPQRDEVLERLAEVLDGRSPAAKVRRAICVGVRHARRQRWSVERLRAWIESWERGALQAVPDDVLAWAITPRRGCADASVMALLDAARVPSRSLRAMRAAMYPRPVHLGTCTASAAVR